MQNGFVPDEDLRDQRIVSYYCNGGNVSATMFVPLPVLIALKAPALQVV